MVLSSSTVELLNIGWFSGKRQEISLRPSTPRQMKTLQRMLRCQLINLQDFSLAVGLPTRVLKVTRAPDRVEVNLMSICTPGGSLDQVVVTETLQTALQLETAEHVELLSKRAGDLLMTLVRFWT